MKKLRCAVIGVGYLGKFHAEKYHNSSAAELVAIVDSDEKNRLNIAQKYSCEAYDNIKSLVGNVDAVSIVTPTKSHFAVAKFCLENDIHTLIEKPITSSTDEAQELITLAKNNDLLIQVGHLERFNSAILALNEKLKQPKFIESQRIAPFRPRGADVNVVLDLMIHDIDLICYLINSEITSISASGVAVLSKEIDIANARIEFKNGAVANVTASRAGSKQERIMRIFQHDAYFSVNLQKKSYAICRKGQGEMFPGIPDIKIESFDFPQGDAIQAEIDAFIDAIINNKVSPVSGEAGMKALKIAQQITEAVSKKNKLLEETR